MWLSYDFYTYRWLHLTSLCQACCLLWQYIRVRQVASGLIYCQVWQKLNQGETIHLMIKHLKSSDLLKLIKIRTYLRANRLTHFFLCSVCWGYPFHRTYGTTMWESWVSYWSLTEGGRKVTEMTHWTQSRQRSILCCSSVRRKDSTVFFGDNNWVFVHPGPVKLNWVFSSHFLQGSGGTMMMQVFFFSLLVKQCPLNSLDLLSFITEVYWVSSCSPLFSCSRYQQILKRKHLFFKVWTRRYILTYEITIRRFSCIKVFVHF